MFLAGTSAVGVEVECCQRCIIDFAEGDLSTGAKALQMLCQQRNSKKLQRRSATVFLPSTLHVAIHL